MSVSQNGYSANDVSLTEVYDIQGTKIRLRKGPPGWLLWHFGCWFDRFIRDINLGGLDDWGYAERKIRGGEDLSNHASGTALDLDATHWPLGALATKYLTQVEIDRIHEQLKLYEGCIRWGADYVGRKDPMHWEIDRNEAECARVQQKIMALEANPQPWLGLADVHTVPLRFQQWYNAFPFRPALPVVKPTANSWGPQSEAALKRVQARYGLDADGICGPRTKRVLWDLGWRG